MLPSGNWTCLKFLKSLSSYCCRICFFGSKCGLTRIIFLSIKLLLYLPPDANVRTYKKFMQPKDHFDPFYCMYHWVHFYPVYSQTKKVHSHVREKDNSSLFATTRYIIRRLDNEWKAPRFSVMTMHHHVWAAPQSAALNCVTLPGRAT